ncbi:MAG: pyridoxal-phosphate dependent enzyme [Bacteroidota bacterium]
MIANLHNIQVQSLLHFSNKNTTVDLLRLDLLHPVVSGNKWFKLKYYLEDAKLQGKTTLASFGGAYSNHIVAIAFAAKEAGLKSIGYIRGERNAALSPTLRDAELYGMQLEFVARSRYADKEAIMQTNDSPGIYWIREGGYGLPGAMGAAGILNVTNTSQYTHLLCAVGTGTMLAGLTRAALPKQQLVGISVLKNHFSIEQEVRALLAEEDNRKSLSIIPGYHFGGYAKHPENLLSFMRELWEAEKVPTDIVYTAKLLFATKQLLAKNYFMPGSRLLIIHSGGLQGNASLPPNTLPF